MATTNGAGTFMFIEADDDPTYCTVNRRSGLCLGMAGPANASLLIQAPCNPAMDPAFRCFLEATGDDVQLVNCLNGLSFWSRMARPSTAPSCWDWDPAAPAAGALSRFELERVAAPVRVPMGESRPEPWQRHNPRDWQRPITSLTGTCQTAPPTVGATDILPFFMVNDPGYSFRKQVEDSRSLRFVVGRPSRSGDTLRGSRPCRNRSAVW